MKGKRRGIIECNCDAGKQCVDRVGSLERTGQRRPSDMKAGTSVPALLPSLPPLQSQYSLQNALFKSALSLSQIQTGWCEEAARLPVLGNKVASFKKFHLVRMDSILPVILYP